MALYDLDPDAHEKMLAAMAYESTAKADPETSPMKEQVVTTHEIAAEHQRLNQRYRQLVNTYGQYVEMFEQWLARHA